MELINFLIQTNGPCVMAIAPLLLAAIMAGAGMLKGMTVDKEKERRQRELAAETQRYSPWTKLKADPIQEADPLGNALSFGMSGYGLGQNAEDVNSKNLFNRELLDVERKKAGMPTLEQEQTQKKMQSNNGTGYGKYASSPWESFNTGKYFYG